MGTLNNFVAMIEKYNWWAQEKWQERGVFFRAKLAMMQIKDGDLYQD